eukprot:PhM_4_TR15258/c0_g1_i1/m.54380
MMRRTRLIAYLGRAHLDLGQTFDGPPPTSAPQPLNMTQTKDWVDPVEMEFPTSIRGDVFPDVPEHHYHDQWYIMNSGVFPGTVTPYSAEVPQNAFRFRPFPDFDQKSREVLTSMNTPQTAHGRGSAPHREFSLAQMDGYQHDRRMTMDTAMSRTMDEKLHHRQHESPMQVQRDAGRLEKPLPGAGERAVDSMFPFHWDSRDFIEYERAKHNMKRFTWQDCESSYMILICGMWDHQAELCAADFKTFLQSVAKQFLEEKIVSLRSQLEGEITVPPHLMEAFSGCDALEIDMYARNHIEDMITECTQTLSRVNSGEYPKVEKMEPYLRMEQFWSDTTTYNNYLVKEASTRKYEWRRYFRAVTMPMPFNDTLFEKRVLDTRLWLHRECTVEFHVTHKRNLVLDFNKFPVQHDPEVQPDHEHHRVFSFALDWKSPQPQLVAPATEPIERLFANDTWESVAARVGCSVESLQAANPDTTLSPDIKELKVPQDAVYKRPKSHPWLMPSAVTEAVFGTTRSDVKTNKLTTSKLLPIPANAKKFPFEWRYGQDRFPHASAMVPGEESWQAYTRTYLDPEFSDSGAQTQYNVNHHWPEQHAPGSVKDTPYEEDQTWFNQQQPIMQYEPFYKDAWVNDLPKINREGFMRSMDWQAP